MEYYRLEDHMSTLLSRGTGAKRKGWLHCKAILFLSPLSTHTPYHPDQCRTKSQKILRDIAIITFAHPIELL
jgi:hypothetical protein